MIIYYINFLICHFLYYHKMKKYSTLLCKVFFLFIIFRYNSQSVIKCRSIVCLNFMFPAPNIVQTVKTSPTFRLTVRKLVGPHLKHSNIKFKHTMLRQKANTNCNYFSLEPGFSAFVFASLLSIFLANAQIIGFVADTASKFFFRPKTFKQVSV